jgi:hypothetical protein
MTSQVVTRRVLLAAGALLALFHVWLFAGQAWEGQLSDPALLVRWLLAVGLVAALIGLRRQRASIYRGRKAVAIWVLAALLHGPAAAHRLDTLGEPALPEFVATLTQLVGTSGIVLALSWALGRALRRRNSATLSGRRIPVSSRRTRISVIYAFVRFAPRPPPIPAA